MTFRRTRRVIGLATVGVLLLLASCSTPAKHASATRTFADALTATSESVKDCYVAVREAEELRYRTNLAEKMLDRRPDAAPLGGSSLEALTVTPEVSNRIFTMLSGLESYAALLLLLGGDDEPVDSVESTKATGAALKLSLDAVDAFTPFEVSDFTEDVAIASTKAAASVGAFLSQDASQADVETASKAMHPYIEAVAAQLIEEIGSPSPARTADGTTRPPWGLRAKLAGTRDTIDAETARVLEALRSDERLNDVDLVKLSLQIFDLEVTRVVHMDFALAETQEALRRMVTAHGALSSPRDPATIQLAETFLAYAQRTVNAFEN